MFLEDPKKNFKNIFSQFLNATKAQTIQVIEEFCVLFKNKESPTYEEQLINRLIETVFLSLISSIMKI